MKSTDQGFPLIHYSKNATPREWGHAHGEQFREGIKELAAIRLEHMMMKSPHLKIPLKPLALEQFEISKAFAPELALELEGIAEGAACSIVDLVVLNNYTDFRDITLPEEGCSTVFLKNETHEASGQTWDMHGSAKNYLCVLEVPAHESTPEMKVLSLVGCLGLMGINQYGVFLGVNNINTRNARAGLIWPLLVRKVLTGKNYLEAEKILIHAPVTSGHNYLLSHEGVACHYEISPDLVEKVAKIEAREFGSIFHTNHCLGEKHKLREDAISANSTTLERESLLVKKMPQTKSSADLITLLQDHEEYPKSICSHYSTSVFDPALTCGAGVFDRYSGELTFWRGCPHEDQNYMARKFTLNNQTFLTGLVHG